MEGIVIDLGRLLHGELHSRGLLCVTIGLDILVHKETCSSQFSNDHMFSHIAFSSALEANCSMTCSFICDNAFKDSRYWSCLTSPISGNNSPMLSLIESIKFIPLVTPCISISRCFRSLSDKVKGHVESLSATKSVHVDSNSASVKR